MKKVFWIVMLAFVAFAGREVGVFRTKFAFLNPSIKHVRNVNAIADDESATYSLDQLYKAGWRIIYVEKEMDRHTGIKNYMIVMERETYEN